MAPVMNFTYKAQLTHRNARNARPMLYPDQLSVLPSDVVFLEPPLAG